MNSARKFCIFLIVVIMLGSYATAVALENMPPSIEFDLTDMDEHVFDIEWQGQHGTITIGEATPEGPSPRFSYDLTEGVGTWSRRIYYSIGIWNLSYRVRYTINSNYRVTIHDLYNFDHAGVFGIEHLEAMIVNATETSQYPAKCFSSWYLSIGIDNFSAGQTATVYCQFHNSVLSVTIG